MRKSQCWFWHLQNPCHESSQKNVHWHGGGCKPLSTDTTVAVSPWAPPASRIKLLKAFLVWKSLSRTKLKENKTFWRIGRRNPYLGRGPWCFSNIVMFLQRRSQRAFRCSALRFSPRRVSSLRSGLKLFYFLAFYLILSKALSTSSSASRMNHIAMLWGFKLNSFSIRFCWFLECVCSAQQRLVGHAFSSYRYFGDFFVQV